jgi:LysM repeat protein
MKKELNQTKNLTVFYQVTNLFIVFFILNSSLFAQTTASLTQDYIIKYKDLAIKEMKRTGIPASIKLAQGMLESGYGKSELAVKANNHFGIKCHNSWTGSKIFHDDDAKKECFRKYPNVYESYKDHSNFISGSQRYTFLFNYKPTDYKAWAKGLKKAGYATNPKYDDLLIGIIENYKLYEFDTGKGKVTHKETYKEPSDYKIGKGSEISTNNRIRVATSKEGDSFKSIADANNLMLWQIFKYNELPKDAQLKTGTKLYLQPKRKKAAHGYEYHIVKEKETMYDIAQEYGIKLKYLYKKNLMEVGTEAEIGQKLFLRKQKKPDTQSKIEYNLD